MKQNKFKIVIPSYNNEKWLEPNIASILNQTYTNYEVLYIDDCSTDNTYETVKHIVADLPNWRVVRNETNMRRGYNLSPYNPLIIDFMKDDEDILLFVDGDDWLYEDDTLKKINQLYNDKNYWMTYGSFVCYPSGDVGNPQNTPYPEEVHFYNAYRKDIWRASHLRTFKWHLYKQIKKEDLIFSETGEFYFHAEDLATSFPCLEMCPREKIGVVPFLTYTYNVSQEARARVENDSSREPGGYAYELKRREDEVRNRTPYKIINPNPQATSLMSGGLGNMMFQVAAAYAFSQNSAHRLVFNPKHVGTLHKLPTAYRDTIFRNMDILEESCAFSEIKEASYRYNPLVPVAGDVYLNGYFQSYKYFHDYKYEIIDLFRAPGELINKLKSKYPIVDSNAAVSMHVRRGNYTNLSNHHHNLSIDYYKNAINYFKGGNFLVFSDDIQWCKENFIGDEFTFVEGNEDYEDLYLISLCKHHIIANSTFSWWGAFLNENPNKVVVFPDKWFGPANSEYKTYDLFPDDWICLTEDCPKIVANLFDFACVHLATQNGRYALTHEKISKHIQYTRNRANFDGISIFTENYLKSNIVNQVNSKYKIGWLLETRKVDPTRYLGFEKYMDKFDFVMTHDQQLLDQYPDKTRFTIFGGTWIKTNNYGLHPKTKQISMIYSDKQDLTGHKLRHIVAHFINGIDLFGRGTSRVLQYKEDALVDYRYSIVIENAKTENYFTEKLVDCLIVGTIPIYWGCPNIEKFFNVDGIIIVNSLQEIAEAVASLNDIDYLSRIEYIKENIELAKQYATAEDWIYENILKDLE